MSMSERTYLSIDLKSFYASVECLERGLDPMTTNLVVADPGRTEKTICLAVSPSLKAYGIPGRARLFEVVQKVRQANRQRQQRAPGRRFAGSSASAAELQEHPELSIDYIVAPPRMAHYMEHSAKIYELIAFDPTDKKRPENRTVVIHCTVCLHPVDYGLVVADDTHLFIPWIYTVDQSADCRLHGFQFFIQLCDISVLAGFHHNDAHITPPSLILNLFAYHFTCNAKGFKLLCTSP